jgi:hypothetical protein
MKYFSSLVLSLLVFGAQANTSDSLIRKHEIGVNLSPLVTTLMGSWNNQPQFSVQYKRVRDNKPNKVFRTGLYFQPMRDYMYGTNPTVVISKSESVLVEQITQQSGARGRLAVGYEHRKPLKTGFTFLFAADAFVGFGNEFRSRSLRTSVIDSIYYQPYVGYQQSINFEEGVTHNKITDFRYRYNEYGLTLNIGLMHPLVKDRWWIKGVFRIDSFLQTGRLEQEDYLNMTSQNSRLSSFNFEQFVISEVSVFYRFR